MTRNSFFFNCFNVCGTLLFCSLAACHGPTNPVAERVNKEVKDKYLKTLNDPSSYELVENTYDTLTCGTYRTALRRELKNSDWYLVTARKTIAKFEKSKDGIGYVGLVYGIPYAQKLYQEMLEARNAAQAQATEAIATHAATVRDTLLLARLHLNPADVYRVDVRHIYRSKNKTGGQQLGCYDFQYFPKRDSLQFIGENPDFEYEKGKTAPVAH